MSDDSAVPSAPTAPSEAPPTGDAPPPAAAPSVEAPPVDAPPVDAPPVDAPSVDAPPVDAPLANAIVTAPKRRRLRWLWWTAGSLVVTALVGLCAYLVVVSNQWSDRVDELTLVSEDLGTQVSDQTAARLAAEEHATSLQSELDTATARITDLANEEAQATDHEAVWINMVDALIECEQGWVDHSTVLKGQMRYTDTTTARAEAELVDYCDGIKTEYADFKAEIGK